MSCSGLRIILDTNVFVCWCDGDAGYGSIMDAIRRNGLCFVLCYDLEREYLRQLMKRFYGAGNEVLSSRIAKFEKEGILLRTDPIEENRIAIHRKDQHVLDCAMSEECPAQIIVTDNTKDFVADTEYLLPIVVTSEDFQIDTELHTLCAEIRRRMK